MGVTAFAADHHLLTCELCECATLCLRLILCSVYICSRAHTANAKCCVNLMESLRSVASVCSVILVFIVNCGSFSSYFIVALLQTLV